MVALVTDEYAEIRLAASMLLKGDKSVTHNDNKALDLLFLQIFTNLKETNEGKLTEDDLSLIRNFIFMNLSNPDYEKYKYLALYNSRIFNYDKPNKYREDVKVINAMFKGLKNSGLEVNLTIEIYEEFLKSNDVRQAHNFEKELEIYFGDVFTRNEFIFGKGLQRLAIARYCGNEDYPVAKNYFDQFLLLDY